MNWKEELPLSQRKMGKYTGDFMKQYECDRCKKIVYKPDKVFKSYICEVDPRTDKVKGINDLESIDLCEECAISVMRLAVTQ